MSVRPQWGGRKGKKEVTGEAYHKVVRGDAGLLLPVTLAHASEADLGRGAEIDDTVGPAREVLDKEVPPHLVGAVLELVHVAVAVAVVCEAVVREAGALQNADELLLGLLLVDETSDECERLEGVRIALWVLVEGLAELVSVGTMWEQGTKKDRYQTSSRTVLSREAKATQEEVEERKRRARRK